MVVSNRVEEHIINVNELVRCLTSETSSLPNEITKRSMKLPLIHKVKNDVCDKEVYEPKVLSIGPYHHGSFAVQDMQKTKYSYLDYILKLNPRKKLADYLAAIKGLEKEVRCCYANEIKMDSDAFLRTLLLDGCFILVALHGIEGIMLPTADENVLDAHPGEVKADNEESDMRQKITHNSTDISWEQENSNQEYFYYEAVSRDLLLLENQIPFSIVQKLHQVFAGTIDTTSSLLNKSMVEAVEKMLRPYTKETPEVCHPKEFFHLLHLCHMLFKPNHICNPYQKDLENPNNQLRGKFVRSSNQFVVLPGIESGRLNCALRCSWRPATVYSAAKIEFKKKEMSSGVPHYSLLDIGFCSDTLEIPSLTIDQKIFCLLRNLVAFEQACPQFGNYITAYVQFWSHLVSTPDDAMLLTKKGVLINHLQSDSQLVEILSLLGENVVFDPDGDYYLKPVFRMVEQHYQHQRPGWRKLFAALSFNIA